MTIGQGQIFASGISILLKGPNEALQIADGNPPAKYVHFVDNAGNTIVPTYEPDGLDAGQGSRIGGVKLVIPSAQAITDLTTRVEALEEQVELLLSVIKFGGENNENTQIWPAAEGGFVQIYAFNGQQILSAGDANPTPVLGFFGATPAGQTTFTGDWNNGAPSDAVLIDTVGRLAKDLSSASGLGLFADERENL